MLKNYQKILVLKMIIINIITQELLQCFYRGSTLSFVRNCGFDFCLIKYVKDKKKLTNFCLVI